MKSLEHPTFWTAGLLIALTLTSIFAIASHQPSYLQAKADRSDKVTNVESRQASKASRIFLDNDGRPVSPSPARLKAAQAAFLASTSKARQKATLMVEKSPIKGGGEFVRLDGRFRSASIAVVNTDGSLSIKHKQ